MKKEWMIVTFCIFMMTGCAPNTETGEVTSFGQSVPASGGLVQSFVMVELADGTEVRAWLPQDDELWRTLQNDMGLPIKIRKEGDFWRFVEIMPERELEKGEISVALLPFMDMSPDEDQEALCTRVGDAVRTALSQDEAIRVAGRESSSEYEGRDREISEFGRRLGVSYVLEGIVKPSDGQVDLALQIVRVEDNTHIWSGASSLDLADIPSIGDKIVPGVIGALKHDVLRRYP